LCAALREENRLGEFEKRMLGRMFGPKMDEVTGEENIMWSFMVFIHNQI
jgi:hypothetical protein